MMLEKLCTALFAALALAGCGDDDAGTGNVEFTVWGEEYIEEGIPTATFEDGWSVAYSQFLIVLGNVTVADESAGDAGRVAGSRLFDLVGEGPHAIGELEGLEARAWDTVGYQVPAADSGTEVHSSATDDDLARMQDGGYSVYIAGAATKGTETKSFGWGFTNSTRYAHCVSDLDGREIDGIVVTNGGTEPVELTIHGDHFFYDDLARS